MLGAAGAGFPVHTTGLAGIPQMRCCGEAAGRRWHSESRNRRPSGNEDQDTELVWILRAAYPSELPGNGRGYSGGDVKGNIRGDFQFSRMLRSGFKRLLEGEEEEGAVISI